MSLRRARRCDTLREATESSIAAFSRYEDAMKQALVESGLVQAGKPDLFHGPTGRSRLTMASVSMPSDGSALSRRYVGFAAP